MACALTRSGGFGARITDPVSYLPGFPSDIKFSPNGESLAVAATTSVVVYAWSSSGFGAVLGDVTPGGNVLGVTYSPNGDYIAVAHSSSPYVSIYPWSGTAFSAKVSDPATTPTGSGYAVAFSPAANAVVVAHATTPYLSAYPWSGGAFGTKYSDPASLPAYNSYAAAFSPDGNYVAVTGGIGLTGPFSPTDYFSVYPWSAGFGTRISAPEQSTGSGNGVAFSPDGAFIAFTRPSVGGISVYPWSAGTFGTKCTAQTPSPAGSCSGIAFNRATV
jgi:WD40 repeat protein